ncbi:MAG: polyhydroxyalkanoate synthesis repressor PhaR, partial [Rickettsiales bacterium]
MQKKDKDKEPAIIKKYANRRLYDTETSAYITLEDLCDRVKEGHPFIVVDAKSGQDLTRQILTQIIFEQETKGFHVLPTDFLRSVIGFYG